MKNARLTFGAPQMQQRVRRGGQTHPCRTLAVERLAYNLEYGDSATCPFIRLKGRWLARAGFLVGARVAVTVRRRCLVIRPLQGTVHPADNSSGKEPE